MRLPALRWGSISILGGALQPDTGHTENKLILNLFWEEIRYLRFPYLTDKLLEIQETLKPEASKEEIVARLRRIFFGSYKKWWKICPFYQERGRNVFN